MNSKTDSSPIPQPIQNRIPALDLLRGFALLGIFLSIIHSFNGSILYGSAAPSGPLDKFLDDLQSLFINRRFIGLLSLLFGVGIAIQQLNFREKAAPFTGYFLRRMFVLAVLGLINTTFYFNGEILFVYAVFGTVVYAISRLPRASLWLLVGFSFVVWGELFEAFLREDFIEWFKWFPEEYPARRIKEIYVGSSLLPMIPLRWLEYAYIYTDNNFHMGMSFAMILSGYLIGIQGWHVRFFENLDRYKWAFALAAIYSGLFGLIGLASRQTSFIFAYDPIVYPFYAVFLLSTLFTYVYGACWYSQRTAGKDPLSQILIRNGRLALTLYMGGAIIYSFIFYGYGLGWFMKYGTAIQLLIALAVYGGFSLFSYLWLKKFKRGPLEALFRKLAYLRLS